MQEVICEKCGETSYTACTEPEDLTASECPFCGPALNIVCPSCGYRFDHDLIAVQRREIEELISENARLQKKIAGGLFHSTPEGDAK